MAGDPHSQAQRVPEIQDNSEQNNNSKKVRNVMKTTILVLLLILAAIISPGAAISITASQGTGGNTYTSSTVFELDPSASVSSRISDGMTEIDISGAGYAEHNGLFTASDSNAARRISSSSQGALIEADGQMAAAIMGDLGFGSDQLNADGTVTISAPILTADGGNANAYCFTGKKWVQNDPQIKLAINPTGSGLGTTETINAIYGAGQTWDAATNQNLFLDNTVSLTTATPGKYDGKNTFGWLTYNTGCTALASAGTWYKLTKVDGYYPIVEVDVAFNKKYAWTTSNTQISGKIDLQSVALHEMGHMIGLGDIYNKAAFTKDTRQVMHYYTGIKRTLGNGDKTGVWALYH
jgi:hypothetical protein